MDKIIRIDGYKPIIENGAIQIYAYAGGKKYPIATAHRDMCDTEHLAIMLRSLKQPELYDTTGEEYIPLYTGDENDG